MWVPVCGRTAPQAPRPWRRKAGPSLPTSSLSAGKERGWGVALSTVGQHVPGTGSASASSTAPSRGPGAAPPWTQASAIPKVACARARREPVSRRSSLGTEGVAAGVPSPRVSGKASALSRCVGLKGLQDGLADRAFSTRQRPQVWPPR